MKSRANAIKYARALMARNAGVGFAHGVVAMFAAAYDLTLNEASRVINVPNPIRVKREVVKAVYQPEGTMSKFYFAGVEATDYSPGEDQ